MSFGSIEGINFYAILLLVGAIGGVGYWLWSQYLSKSSGFSVKFANMPSYAQTAVTELISGQGQINFALNGVAKNFTVSQITSGSDFIGLTFTSSDTSPVVIYLSYYEYLNWYAVTNATLAVPARTLANGAITDNITGSYTINFNMTTLVMNITSAATTATSQISYPDVYKNNIIIPTTFLSMSSNITDVPTQTSYVDFTPKSNLDSITSNLLSGRQSVISALTYAYNTGSRAAPAGSSTQLVASEFQLSSQNCGYNLVNSDGTLNIYLTYYELLHLLMNTASGITIPTRRITNNAIVDSFTNGYSLYITGSAITAYPYNTPMTETMVAPANVVDIYGQGITYPFYITSSVIGMVNEGIISTFMDRQFMLQYKLGGVAATVTAEHISLNNKQCGVKLSVTAGAATAVIYISYSQLINWLLSDFKSAGANASLTVQAYTPGKGTTVDVTAASVDVLVPATGSFTLAFDATNNAQINITQSTTAVAVGFNPTVTYKNTAVTPNVNVTINANTGS